MRPGGEIDAPSGAAVVPTVVPPVSPIPTEEPPAPERGGKMVVEDLPPPSPLTVQPPPTVETAQSPPVPRGNRLGTLYDNLRTDNYCLAEKHCGVFEGEDESDGTWIVLYDFKGIKHSSKSGDNIARALIVKHMR